METRLSRGAPEFRGKVVDFTLHATPDAIAEAICRELAFDDGEAEVGYVAAGRVVPRPIPAAVPAASAVPAPGAVFLVTGGARGVTAVVAREMGRRFGASLHLIGASPAPEIPEAWRSLGEAEMKELKATVMKDALAQGQKPADAWSRFEKSLEIDRTLREFAEVGVQARYHACDVGDRAALGRLLEEIRRTDGPIQGILHGAGFERACRLEKKQPDLVERTFSAKVDGAANLMELTKNDPVRWFAAFGSVSGRFGGVGQADYSVANEMLAKLIDWYRSHNPRCGAAVFHWHAWDDVGMAVRPESQHIRKLHNMQFMPSLEGARHLLDELQAGLPEPEVLITELAPCRERYASVPSGTETAAAESEVAERLPFADRILVQTPGEHLIMEMDVDPTSEVFLVQHIFRGRPLLPGVIATEAMAEAASHLLQPGESIAAVENVQIVAGLRFLTDAPRTVRIHARRDGDRVDCQLTCDTVNRRGQLLLKDKLHFQASILVTKSRRAVKPPEIPAGEPWLEVWYPEEDTVIWHGPAFRCLRQMTSAGPQRALAKFVAGPVDGLAPGRSGKNWLTPAALLDSCFFACGVFLWHAHQGVTGIPDALDRLELVRMPRGGEQCLAVLTDKGRDGSLGCYDCTVYGEDGGVLVQVRGYRNRIVSEEPAHAI